MNKFLTIVIPSYKSSNRILLHLKKLSKKIQIIIVENSQDKKLKEKVEKKHKDTKVILKKNLGYGNAINFGAKLVKTKFFFVMNPDTTIYKNTLNKLVDSAKKIKKFGMISPEHIFNKKKNKIKKKNIIEKRILTGGAMLFNTKIFKKINGFDKNIFLYYEDNDYFTKCNQINLKLYLVKNAFHYHKMKNSSSATFKDFKEKYNFQLIAGWHGQWSKFYYIKKYEGYFKALIKCLPNLITNIFQLLINSFFNINKCIYLYYKIEGLISSMIGLSSFKRAKCDK